MFSERAPQDYSSAETGAGFPPGFTAVRILLGLVLLTAAGFKAYALWGDPSPLLGLFSSPRWQVLFIEAEVLLGLWLLTGLAPLGAWFAASCLFTLMAGVSLYLALAGWTSCGCFGPLRVNPWYSFVGDLAALAALWKWGPRTASFRGLLARSGLRFHPGTCCAVGLILVTAIGLLALPGDSSLGVALARLRGESLVIDPPVSDVGEGVYGEQREFEIEVRNYSDRPVRILGGTADCDCVATRDLPVTVPPGGARKITITVTLVGAVGAGQQAFKLYTDQEEQFVVIGRYVRRLVSEQQSSR